MKLINFYTRLIESLGLIVEDGYVMTQSGGQIKLDNVPLVLPTKHHKKTYIENGKLVKYLFNPLNEGLASRRKDITWMMKVLNVNVNSTVLSLMSDIVSSIDKDTKSISLELATLINELSEIKGNAKKLVLESTIKMFEKFTPKTQFVKVYLRVPSKKKSQKFTLGVSIKSPLLEDLESGRLDIRRRVDKDLLERLLQYLVGGLLEFKTESNHDHFPEVEAILNTLIPLENYFKDIADTLGFENIYPECKITPDDIANLNRLYSAVQMVPDTDNFEPETTVSDYQLHTPTIQNQYVSAGEVDESVEKTTTSTYQEESSGDEMISIEEARRRREQEFQQRQSQMMGQAGYSGGYAVPQTTMTPNQYPVTGVNTGYSVGGQYQAVPTTTPPRPMVQRDQQGFFVVGPQGQRIPTDQLGRPLPQQQVSYPQAGYGTPPRPVVQRDQQGFFVIGPQGQRIPTDMNGNPIPQQTYGTGYGTPPFDPDPVGGQPY